MAHGIHQAYPLLSSPFPCLQTRAAAVEAPPSTADWAALAAELDSKSPLEIMDNVRRRTAGPAAAA